MTDTDGRIRKRVVTALAGLAVATAVSARLERASAQLDVGFDVSTLVGDYDAETSSLRILQIDGRSGAIWDTEVAGQGENDFAVISGIRGGRFSLLTDLIIVNEGGGRYSATGTYSATDVDRNTNAVEAVFASTQIQLRNGILSIDGLLAPMQNADSILVNRESQPNAGDWVFAGVFAHTPELPNRDGVRGTITIGDVDPMDTGVMAVIALNIREPDLDRFFAEDRHFESGEVKGVITPEPATVLLLAMGAVLALARQRRD